MKILFVSSEATGYAKSGGLADVVTALSTSLSSLGHECKVFLPFYSFIAKDGFKKVLSFQLPMLGENEKAEVWEKEENGVTFSLLSHPYFSERKGIYGDTSFTPYPDNCPRFILFSKAAALFCLATNFQPDIVHAHDWPCGFVAHFFHYFKAPLLDAVVSSSVIPKGAKRNNQINMMAEAILSFDKITSVSPTYAKEILTAQYGAGLEDILKLREKDLSGILNGIDDKEWNPETDKYIPHTFSIKKMEGKTKDKLAIQKEFRLEENPDIPLIAIISRLCDQKGFDTLLLEGEECVLERLLKKNNSQFALIGTGDSRYITVLSTLMTKYKNLSVKIVFSTELSHQLEAGADFFLMPSRYEPCGLNQMYSLRYGTLPIVHSTGGLKDTVCDIEEKNGNGFSFISLTAENIEKTVERAVSFYGEKKELEKVKKRAMSTDYSWNASAKRYIELYSSLLKD